MGSFQLFKAAVLIGVVLLLRFNPEDVTSTGSFFYSLFYVAMRGNMPAMQAAMQGGSALLGIVACLALYLAFLGLGLLDMKTWARRSVMLTSGITVLLYAKSVLMPAEDSFSAAASQSSLVNLHTVLLLLDVLVFMYFLRGATAESFRLRATADRGGRLAQLSH